MMYMDQELIEFLLIMAFSFSPILLFILAIIGQSVIQSILQTYWINSLFYWLQYRIKYFKYKNIILLSFPEFKKYFELNPSRYKNALDNEGWSMIRVSLENETSIRILMESFADQIKFMSYMKPFGINNSGSQNYKKYLEAVQVDINKIKKEAEEQIKESKKIILTLREGNNGNVK